MKSKLQRSDKEHNSALIRSACLQILQERRGKKPTVKELCAKSGLSATAVKRHLKTLELRGQSEALCTLRILTDDVKLSLYRAAMKGNVAAAKLWFMVVENWTERTETKISGQLKVENKPPVILKIIKR